MLLSPCCFSSVHRYQLDRSSYVHLVSSPQLTYLFSLFHEHGYSVRLVGGAVRDILLGSTPHDIDLATPVTTDEILKLTRGDSNIELVYTRAEQFGTLTLIVGTTAKKTFQVTTLKKSIIRRGADVHVEFTDDWSTDAHQRDLSINSLSMDQHGIIYDYTNSIDDLKHSRIRFNGNVCDRLGENPIRILRYFRFFARLSTNPQNHDRNVLENIKQSAVLLKYVSGEKIWTELRYILRSRWAGHVMRTILECHLGSMLSIPESTIGMLELENRWLRCMNDQPEPMTLLVTLFDNVNELNRFCMHMKCSSRDRQLAIYLLNHRYSIEPDHHDDPLRSYKDQIIQVESNQQTVHYQFVLELLKYQGHQHLLDDIKKWSIPNFPIDFEDLRQQGLLGKSQLCRLRRKLKEQWKQSEYRMSKQELIDYGFQSGLFYT